MSSRRMRAAVLREPGRPVTVEEVELDAPKAGEVLVRIAAAGVCHSDVRLADGDLGPGKWPAVMGHEGAGVVEEIGEGVSHVVPGDHVALCFVPACRSCRYCLAGKPNLCLAVAQAGARGTLLDGTSRLRLPDGTTLQHGLRTACFAEYAVVASGGAVAIPRELPLWQAALLGCGVVTGVGAVRNAARVQPGAAAAVIGCGGVGLQVVAGLRLAGADPIVALDRVPEKLELALAQGATHAIATSTEPDPVAALRELTDGGVDFAFEVVGHPETIRLAWDVTRPGGTAVVVGLAPDGVEARVPAIEFLDDKSLRGTYYGSGDPAAELPLLAAMALAGELDLAGVVTSVEPLDAVEEALDRLRRGEGARTVLVIDPALAGIEPSRPSGSR
ncbi:MAG TPA: zinc-binding dehydrogenase [Gaiellaceae bacterium]|jgi:S-(hydroxymethyl)glutathione dehydrogenase/alcohol dehydrogenase|nr:zinc-binding dehydrogenase [Gaiellaceae bacterium]